MSALNSLAIAYPVPNAVNKPVQLNDARDTALNQSVQPAPSIDDTAASHPGIGKFAINKKIEPTINNGVEIKKPSRIAINTRLLAVFTLSQLLIMNSLNVFLQLGNYFSVPATLIICVFAIRS